MTRVKIHLCALSWLVTSALRALVRPVGYVLLAACVLPALLAVGPAEIIFQEAVRPRLRSIPSWAGGPSRALAVSFSTFATAYLLPAAMFAQTVFAHSSPEHLFLARLLTAQMGIGVSIIVFGHIGEAVRTVKTAAQRISSRYRLQVEACAKKV